MTISTSSSVRRTAPVWLMLALSALLATVVVLWASIDPSDNHGQPSASAATASGEAGDALLAALQANFDLATRRANPRQARMTIMPRDNAAGIACNPATLAGNTASFRMVLPRSFADRNTALTALAPDGRLWIVYLSYGPDTDPEDLIIPSRSIDWERARTHNDFVVDVSAFEALRHNENVPERLFQQAGVYQFALINEVDRELLEDDGTPFRVIAGCVVHWSPR